MILIKKTKFFLLLLIFQLTIFSQGTPYILLISFDGFRYDYLDRNITPNLEKFSNEGVRALSLRPCFPTVTFSNHYSIITGMHPENHGIIDNYFLNKETGEKYRLGDTISMRESKWYIGEAFWETAKKNGIKTACFFWPGSEVTDVNRQPNYFKKYQQDFPLRARIDTIVAWFSLPRNLRPHFITLYYHTTDSYGHDYGTNSPEINFAIKQLDSLVFYLEQKIISINMQDSINIIILSDHGMQDLASDKFINLDEIIGEYKFVMFNSKSFATIYAKDNCDEIYQKLVENQNYYSVYKKDEIPSYFNYSNNKNIPDILVVSDLGWSLVTNKTLKDITEGRTKGNHGYQKDEITMHGIFIAKGPAFKNNFKTGTLWNIDIYTLLCKIFNIKIGHKIDGDLSRIEFILRRN